MMTMLTSDIHGTWHWIKTNPTIRAVLQSAPVSTHNEDDWCAFGRNCRRPAKVEAWQYVREEKNGDPDSGPHTDDRPAQGILIAAIFIWMFRMVEDVFLLISANTLKLDFQDHGQWSHVYHTHRHTHAHAHMHAHAHAHAHMLLQAVSLNAKSQK